MVLRQISPCSARFYGIVLIPIILFNFSINALASSGTKLEHTSVVMYLG
jgi:hypothetical protein